MASVKFNLKHKDKDRSPIFMCVYYGAFKKAINKTTGKEYQKTVYLKYYISETVDVKYWLHSDCRVKKTTAYSEGRELNARLNDIETRTLSIIRELQIKDVGLNNDVIKTELDKVFRSHKDQTNKEDTNDLMGFIEFFINTSNRATSTKKNYTRVLTDLKEYAHEKGKRLSFEQIDIDFHNDFITYLQARNYAPNTVGTRIKILKTFMNEAYERGIHSNLDFKKKAFSKPKEDTSAIYVTENELDKMYKLDLSKDKKLEQVRDWFLIGAYTGLRFSDLSRLSKDNLSQDNITIQTQKTGTTVVIPLHSTIKKILMKYHYHLPKMISNEKFNEYIKEVSKQAKINDSILVEETKGTLKTKKTEKKYNLISAHTARRSFATNAFLAGIPPIQIMKITGHKTEKSFMIYIKISEQENAKKLQLHPFFNKLIVNE